MAVTEINVPASGGGSIPCRAAIPEGGPSTGVVIAPTIFGLNNDMDMVLERLAGEGFAAVVPNPFWRDEEPGIIGHSGDDRERAFARLGRTPFDQAFSVMEDAINDLRGQPHCNGKIALMGFCYGGPFAMVAGAKCGIQAGLSYHGSFVQDHLDVVPDVKCPLSFHWGDNDNAAPLDVIETVKESFSTLDSADVFLYEGGVAHGYMLPGHGDAYNEAAAELSWERSLSLLKSI
ncbi:MAG: dienelactone hydrolase family protein [Alphaproteobacteria bacterium]